MNTVRKPPSLHTPCSPTKLGPTTRTPSEDFFNNNMRIANIRVNDAVQNMPKDQHVDNIHVNDAVQDMSKDQHVDNSTNATTAINDDM